MLLRAYLAHLRARNLSPKTIKATEEYLRLFLHRHDPLTASKRDLETYLGAWLLGASRRPCGPPGGI